MVDFLVAWGVTQAVGFVFKPILEDLAKDAAKDLAKDLFKDSLKKVLKKEPLEIAAGKALKEFLQLIQDELEEVELTEEQLKTYTKPLKQFIKDKSVREILGNAFKDDCQLLDTKTLAKIWHNLDLSALPEEFNWERVGKKYLKKVKAIVRESDELRSILDSENIEAIQQNTKEIAGIVPEFDLRRYQEGLQKRYGNLNLDSLDTTVYDYREKLKVWQIFIAQNVRECQEFLPQVYEIPKEHQKRLRESNELEVEVDPEEWERYKQVYYQQPIRSVLDVVNDPQNYPYAVILGDPGSGKSTLLQFIALNWARSPLNNVISQPIPLLIELRSYKRDRISGQCKDFLGFFHNGNVIYRLNQHQLNERLKAGKVLVMFDGLDEVFDPTQREEVITDIHRFTNEYPNVRVIVTSRIIGYKPQRLRDAEFRHFLLQDLESEQIEDFLNRWHELTFTDEADKVRKRERLQQAIKTSSAIGELAGNPLLLTMMAILNRNQELPRDRPELYNQASRVLLHQWDVEQKLLENPRIDSVAIDYKDKQAMLRQVAYHMQAADQGLSGNLISAADLEKILIGYLKTIEFNDARTVARLLIEQLRSRNFILCFVGADSYGFVHRTFLEYFCACEFVERFGKRGIEGGLTLEELKTEVFGKHWQDESWHEVLRLIAGMLEANFTGEIIEYLIQLNGETEKFINLFLAAKCLFEVRNRSIVGATATQLLNQLKSLLNYGWDCFEEHSIDQEYVDLVYKIHTQAVVVVATTWKDDPDTLPWLKSLAQSHEAEPRSHISFEAVQALAQGWKDDRDTLPWLKYLAQFYEGEPGSCLSDAAVQALAQNWKDDPHTLPLLKSLAQSHEDGSVRSAAVQALAQNWKDDPDTLPLLKSLAQSDKSAGVRRAAVQALAQGWKDAPDTLAIAKSCAVSDVDDWVRNTALQELARGWKDEPWMFEFLCDRAINDPSERSERDEFFLKGNPRQTALEAIIKQYPDHPQTLPLLQDSVENDPDEKVREFAAVQAVEILAHNGKDDPDTLPLLKSLAQSHESARLRIAAVKALAQGWKDNLQTLAIVKSCSVSDVSDGVRRMAVQELARGWKDEPWLFEFLCNCAVNDPFEREYDWEDNTRQLALEIIIQQYPDHPQTLSLLQDRAENDPDEKVREFAVQALQALAHNGKDDPDTLPLLKSLAQSGHGTAVRMAAVKALAQRGKDDPDTLSLLRSLAQSHEDGSVRSSAVQALAHGWKDHLETLAIVKSCAVTDVNYSVRNTALQELARGWKDEPWMFDFLCDRAINDPFKRKKGFTDWWGANNPRFIAIKAIIKQYPNHLQTLPLLQDRAENDPHERVREFAVQALQALVHNWKDDPDTLPLLKSLAQSDKSVWVRKAAVQALAQGWKDHLDTLVIVKSCAVSDVNNSVRNTALQELARGWKDEPWMFDFLRNRALNDPFERKEDWEKNPRQLALEIIIKQYRDHPQTLPLCKDRAENDPDEKVREFASKKLAALEKDN